MKRQLLIKSQGIFYLAFFLMELWSPNSYSQNFTYQWGHPAPQGNMVYNAVFENSQTGWAVTGGGNLLKTTDGGSHWTMESFSDSLFTDYFDIIQTQQGTLIISGDSGIIMRSTDQGKTWNKQQFSNGGSLLDLAQIPGGNIGAAGEQGVVLISTDDGITWVNKGPGGSGYARNQYWKSALEGYVVGFNMFYRTLDGGNTWNVVDTLIGFGLNEIFFTDDKSGFAIEDFTQYETIDGGNTWTKSQELGDILYRYRTLVLDSLHWFSVAFGEGGELWETIDGGLHWEERFTYNTVGFISLFTNGSRIFFTSDTGDIFYTDDNGLTTTNAITNLSTEPYAPITIIRTRPDGTAFANNQPSYGVENQTFYRSDDGGKSWYVPDQVPGLRWITDIYFLSNQQGVLGSGNDVRYTLDGGATWNESTIPDNYEVINFDSPNASEYFAAAYLIQNSSGFGNIYKSTDQGSTWQRIDGGLPLNGLYLPLISFANETTGYISYLKNNVNQFYKTTDGGHQWTILNSKGINDRITSMLWISADTGFAAVPNWDKGVYRTIDGGLNWTKVSDEGASQLTRDKADHIAALDSRHGYFIETTDFGNHWTNYYPPFAAHYPDGDRSIQTIHAISNGYLIGGTGNRLMLASRIPDTGTGIDQSFNDTKAGSSFLSVAPNPVSSNTFLINIQLNTNEIARLEIKNMKGQTIKILMNKNLPSGIYQFQFNTRQVFNEEQSGAYLVTLTTPNSFSTYKLIYIK